MYNYTITYLKSFKKVIEDGWMISFKTIDNYCFEERIILKLVLLNPKTQISLVSNSAVNKEKIVKDKIPIIQGPRTFTGKVQLPSCQAIDIWGYDCPFDQADLVNDHLFPYSLGGVTSDAYNLRVLCHWHNQIKSSDIHVYPWEKLFNEYAHYQKTDQKHWIDEQIEKIMFHFNKTK